MDVVWVVVDAVVWDDADDANGTIAVLVICLAAVLRIEEDWDEEDLADANKILDNSFFE